MVHPTGYEQLRKNYNIMILYGCVNFMADCFPKILFPPLNGVSSPLTFHSVTFDFTFVQIHSLCPTEHENNCNTVMA